MKEFIKKFTAISMCLILAAGLAACGHGYGTDGPLEEQINIEEGDNMDGKDGKTLKLIDEAWAAEDSSDAYSTLENLQNVTEQVHDLSMELLMKGMQEGTSSMISPVSILMAMAMVENGASGVSLEQMEEAFGCDAESLSLWLRAWKSSLRTSEDTNMNVANSFWFRDSESLQVKEEYLKTISSMLDAQAYKSAFNQGTADDMNQWCDDNTYGMIKKIINTLTPQDMTVLLNATAFEGVWEEPYEEYQIHEDEVFTKEDGTEENAVMMYSREGVYMENDQLTGFRKPYKDGYSFVALLPCDGLSVADCARGLDGEAWRGLISSARSEKVNAVIPEFTSAFRMDNLIQVFSDMGITDIFAPDKADLSAMAELDGGQPLFVSGIIHKTFIEVNRKGTRAAAVTGIKVGTTAFMPEKIYDVRLDRPFIYAIVDDATNTPMFIGTTMSVAAEQ
ncbi:MAG: serpin family protein [Firmicutes bacterium]|nr:serpin family protein [Bacillota bacterium]